MGAGGSFRSRTKVTQSVETCDDTCDVDERKVFKLESRILQLEDLLRSQSGRLGELETSLSCMQKEGQRTVSVLQYNILASYLGRNTQPWFLYGASITPEARKTLLARFIEKDINDRPKYLWPAYAQGILSAEEISAVEEQDQYFDWERRKWKLVSEIREADVDIISLVELDQLDFFASSLKDSWDGVFQKRPRSNSPDGCGVFWRRSKFEMVSWLGVDLVDGSDAQGREYRDRSCVLLLLRFRACRRSLVIVCTHLAKDPDNRAQTAIRVRQVTQIMQSLTAFTKEHEVTDAPVILCGDLNSRHFGEIRGIARTVWQIKGVPIHPFLWNASDVPTGPTSVTKARQCRIDVVQFMPSQLEMIEVKPVPKLTNGEVIPNCMHPSDHFPVCVRFKVKDDYQKHKETARSWLECVAGRQKVHPLTEAELIHAFEFFDRDGSKYIHRHDMEEACVELHSNVDVDVQRLLLDCFPDRQISYENFVRAYEARLNHHRMRCVGDLEHAFQFFAEGSTRISKETLKVVFREITPVSFSDHEVQEMIDKLHGSPNEEDVLYEDSVDLQRFCEVVCHATFPHRTTQETRRLETCPVRSRSESKDLASRLSELNDCIKRRSLSGSFSPAMIDEAFRLPFELR